MKGVIFVFCYVRFVLYRLLFYFLRHGWVLVNVLVSVFLRFRRSLFLQSDPSGNDAAGRIILVYGIGLVRLRQMKKNITDL